MHEYAARELRPGDVVRVYEGPLAPAPGARPIGAGILLWRVRAAAPDLELWTMLYGHGDPGEDLDAWYALPSSKLNSAKHWVRARDRWVL